MPLSSTGKVAVAALFAIAAQYGVAEQFPREALQSERDSAAPKPSDAKRAEALRQLAELERRINAAGGPRTRYLSTMTEDEPFKSYYKRFAERVERAGTDRFPKKNGKSVYGSVALNVSLDARGRVTDVSVFKSDDQLLSTYSTNLIRSLQPFEALSDEMARAADRVVLTARFAYQHVE